MGPTWAVYRHGGDSAGLLAGRGGGHTVEGSGVGGRGSGVASRPQYWDDQRVASARVRQPSSCVGHRVGKGAPCDCLHMEESIDAVVSPGAPPSGGGPRSGGMGRGVTLGGGGGGAGRDGLGKGEEMVGGRNLYRRIEEKQETRG